MWLGDVLQSNDIVKHSAGIRSYGSSSAKGKSSSASFDKWVESALVSRPCDAADAGTSKGP